MIGTRLVLRRSTGRKTQSRFVEGWWVEGYNDLYQKLTDNPLLNAGQISIIRQQQDPIYQYLNEVGSDYNEDDFLAFLQSEDILGDYFEFLSETYTQFAEDLVELNDHATGGDGVGRKLYLGVAYD